MLTEIYIAALVVDEEAADQDWDAWDEGEIDDQVAWLAWWLISSNIKQPFRPLWTIAVTASLKASE
jgi:hypothetical protein